jgi:hypothetical protein
MQAAEIEGFAERFTWVRMWLGGFRILRDPGPVQGDCKSFALTVAWLIAGRSVLRMVWQMLTLRTVIWVCWSGELHAATWVRGGGWICNIFPAFAPHPGNIRLFPVPALMPLVALISVL